MGVFAPRPWDIFANLIGLRKDTDVDWLLVVHDFVGVGCLFKEINIESI